MGTISGLLYLLSRFDFKGGLHGLTDDQSLASFYSVTRLFLYNERPSGQREVLPFHARLTGVLTCNQVAPIEAQRV